MYEYQHLKMCADEAGKNGILPKKKTEFTEKWASHGADLALIWGNDSPDCRMNY